MSGNERKDNIQYRERRQNLLMIKQSKCADERANDEGGAQKCEHFENLRKDPSTQKGYEMLELLFRKNTKMFDTSLWCGKSQTNIKFLTVRLESC